jgi:hypothetical protein
MPVAKPNHPKRTEIMAIYKNIDDDTDDTYEFSLICDAVLDHNPDVRECRFADKLVHTLVCEALDFLWGIARKRVNVNARYEYDVALRITRERLDRRTMPGMSDYIAEAENWFRWEDDELILVNWLFRNPLDQAESEQRRRVVEKERHAKPESVKRMERRKRQNPDICADRADICADTCADRADNPSGPSGQHVRTDTQHVRTRSDFAEYEVSGHGPDTHPNNNNNNNNIQQKHVFCPELSDIPRPPISGSEALDETRRILREIPLPESASAACSPLAFRAAMQTYFENDSRGNAVGLLNLPSGPEKYLTRLYIDLSPYPPDAIRTAVEAELQRPINPDNPNDGMILQTMTRIIADSAKIVEKSQKRRIAEEKKSAEAERERIAEDERKRDAADFEALCELLAEGTERDLESAMEERYPIANAVGGQRKMIEMNRRILRKRIRKRIEEMKKKEVKI